MVDLAVSRDGGVSTWAEITEPSPTPFTPRQTPLLPLSSLLLLLMLVLVLLVLVLVLLLLLLLLVVPP